MNILSTQQMLIVESKLIKLAKSTNISIKLPPDLSKRYFESFKTNLLTNTLPKTQNYVRKMVSLTENLQGLSRLDQNSSIKAVLITILTIVYKEKFRGQSNSQNAQFLLETLKCSLYSLSVNFGIIKGYPYKINCEEWKAKCAYFFEFMAQQNTLTTSRIKCFVWILQENTAFFDGFILFLRCILSAIGIQGADSWQQKLPQTEVLENLLDYFDLSYRSIDKLILLREEGLLLAVSEDEIVMGEYFQNQCEKLSQQKQLQIKSSVKLHMIQSVLVNTQEKPKKKNAIAESDAKLFNFLLESTENEQTLQLKQNNIQTPKFKESQNNFQFGKKHHKDSFRPQEVRSDFEKLIMDESKEEEFYQQCNQAPTPFLGGGVTSQNGFGKRDIFQHPDFFDQIQCFSSPNQAYRNLTHCSNNRKSVQDRHQHSPLIKHETNTRAITELGTSKNAQAYSSNQYFNFSDLLNCPCRDFRLKRNKLTSRVVEISLNPESTKQMTTSTFPRFLTFKNQKQMNSSLTPNKQFFRERKSMLGEERIPAFLKNIKRDKIQKLPEKPAFQFDRYPNVASQKNLNIQQKLITHQESNFKHHSVILKQNQSNELSKLTAREERSINKYKNENSQLNYQDRFNNPYTQGQKQGEQMNYYKRNQTTKGEPLAQPRNQNLVQKKFVSPLKFFAPVQIIAPTVYVNSNSSNKIIVKIGDMQKNLQAGQKQPQYNVQSHKSEKVLRYFQG